MIQTLHHNHHHDYKTLPPIITSQRHGESIPCEIIVTIYLPKPASAGGYR